MFTSYNYFQQHNNQKPIKDFKRFYREFSNDREFGGKFTFFDQLIKCRFLNNLSVIYSAILRRSPKNILDIGCGNGSNLLISKMLSHIDYCGLDYAEKTIEIARKHFPDVTFFVRDAFSTKFKKESFDCIILSSVLILYENKNDQEKLINESLRILTRDGILILVAWNASPLLYISMIISRFFGRLNRENLPKDFNGVHFSKSDLIKLISKCNAKITSYQRTSEYYGALECIRYLNFSKYRRVFNDNNYESENRIHPQSLFEDLLKQSSGAGEENKLITMLFYSLAKFIPSSLSFFSVSIITKNS